MYNEQDQIIALTSVVRKLKGNIIQLHKSIKPGVKTKNKDKYKTKNSNKPVKKG